MPQPWLEDFKEFLNDPRLTMEEFWVKYTLYRMKAQPKMRKVETEAQALEFYRSSPYGLWRQVVHRRHSAWRTVLRTMRRPDGLLVEFGGGIGSVISWVQRRKRDWRYVLIDVPSKHYEYGLWRSEAEYGWPYESADVITAFDVFEHLQAPVAEAERMRAHLAPGGYLHWNFIAHASRGDLDLATPAQREKTVAYLRSELRTVWEVPGHIIGVKPDQAPRGHARPASHTPPRTSASQDAIAETGG